MRGRRLESSMEKMKGKKIVSLAIWQAFKEVQGAVSDFSIFFNFLLTLSTSVTHAGQTMTQKAASS